MPHGQMRFLVVAVAVLAGACASSSPSGGTAEGPSPDPTRTRSAPDSTYGYTQEKAIRVGGGLDRGAANERAYLRTLRGPNGEPVTFVRKGSCCRFDHKEGPMGTGFLDIYEVTYPGLAKPVTLYLDMYRAGELLIPVGFTAGPDLDAAPEARST